MLAHIERKSRAIPGPDEHYAPLSWKAIGGDFSTGADPKKGRVTFCDEAIKKSKQLPGCADYNLEAKYRYGKYEDENLEEGQEKKEGKYILSNIELGNMR